MQCDMFVNRGGPTLGPTAVGAATQALDFQFPLGLFSVAAKAQLGAGRHSNLEQGPCCENGLTDIRQELLSLFMTLAYRSKLNKEQHR
jgi:hypothetical protein